MSPWPEVNFGDLVSDETGGNAKTLQSDYLPEGTYPIVDQGQSLIGGYTNDNSRVCKSELPVIIFGDHTKCFKYIDFPFCLGADGTKVLKPKRQLNERYLFYALRRIHIPEAGYSRHFKYLKKGKIPLPPLEEQKQIAATLDQADEVCRKRQRAIDRLNDLGQAIFIEMFGAPSSNPMGWNVARLGEIVRVGDRINYGVVQPGDAVNTGVPLIRVGDLLKPFIDPTLVKRIDPLIESAYARSRLEGDEILVGCVGSIGAVALAHEGLKGANIARAVARVPIDHSKVDRRFLAAMIRSSLVQRYFRTETRTVAQPTLNIGLIVDAPILLPPLELQQQFSLRLAKLESIATAFELSLSASNRLVAALQHRAFRGELNASRLIEAVE